MNTTTKRMGILEVFRTMFSSEPDIEDYESVALPKELEDTKKALEVRENKVKQGFNTETKGGFAKRINPDTEKAMRAMHSKVANKVKQEQDRERGE